jgi:hypothetical protein
MDGREHPFVFENFAARRYDIPEYTLDVYGHRAIFEVVGAKEWIEAHRIPRYGPLDIVATATSLGVPVTFDSNDVGYGRVRGPRSNPIDSDEPLAIQITPSLRTGEDLVTFGHEIGHIFLDLVLETPQESPHQEVEDFCELFGNEMALPRRELVNISKPDEQGILALMDRYGVDLSTVLLQLCETRKLPRKIVIATKVPQDWGANSGEVVEEVFCFDCEQIEYKSCEELAEELLPRLDFSDFVFAGQLATCGNQTKWWHNNEATDDIFNTGESVARDWRGDDKPF